MSRTTRLYKTLQEFQDQRAERTEKYNRELIRLKKYEGSSGFADDMNRVTEAYYKDLMDLQGRYSPMLDEILNEMEEKIGTRTIKAPSEEELRLLQALKLKSKPTMEECERIANTVRECPFAVSIVADIAKSHGYLHDLNHLSREMSSQVATNIVKGMRKDVADFVQHDTTRNSRIYQKHNLTLYGVQGEAKKRDLFKDEAGCYAEVCGMDENTLNRFSAVVD